MTTIQDIIQVLIEPVWRSGTTGQARTTGQVRTTNQVGSVGQAGQTVDALKFGDPHSEVTGIVTTFMPTQRVLEEAAASGANLVIAHESPFYNHHDHFEQTLQDDPVYQHKKQFIHESRLAIFRLHDTIHRYEPDGIMEGLINVLGWTQHVTEHEPYASIVELPSLTVTEVAAHVKRMLGLAVVRAAGNLDAACTKIGLLVGYRGNGELVIPLFARHKPELVIYGEGREWEAPEYVRDAAWQGSARAVLALGHAESEAAGMQLVARRLARQFPHIPVYYLTDGPVFHLL